MSKIRITYHSESGEYYSTYDVGDTLRTKRTFDVLSLRKRERELLRSAVAKQRRRMPLHYARMVFCGGYVQHLHNLNAI